MARAGRAAQGARSGGGHGARLGAVRGRRWHGENTVRTGAMRAVGGGSGQGARSRHVSPRAAAAGAGRAAAAARGGGRAASAGALLFGPALPRPRRRGRASPLESAGRRRRSSPCAEGASSPRRALSALLRRLPGTPKAERSSAPRRLSPRPERQGAIGWIRVQCRRERAGP